MVKITKPKGKCSYTNFIGKRTCYNSVVEGVWCKSHLPKGRSKATALATLKQAFDRNCQCENYQLDSPIGLSTASTINLCKCNA